MLDSTIKFKKISGETITANHMKYVPDNPFKKSDSELASKVSELIFNSDRPYH